MFQLKPTLSENYLKCCGVHFLIVADRDRLFLCIQLQSKSQHMSKLRRAPWRSVQDRHSTSGLKDEVLLQALQTRHCLVSSAWCTFELQLGQQFFDQWKPTSASKPLVNWNHTLSLNLTQRLYQCLHNHHNLIKQRHQPFKSICPFIFYFIFFFLSF